MAAKSVLMEPAVRSAVLAIEHLPTAHVKPARPQHNIAAIASQTRPFAMDVSQTLPTTRPTISATLAVHPINSMKGIPSLEVRLSARRAMVVVLLVRPSSNAQVARIRPPFLPALHA